MANVTASVWTAALDGTDAAAYTTASLTGIPTNSPTFLYITCTGGAALVAPTVVTTGLTWVLVGSYTLTSTMVFLYVCCDTAGTALGTTAISWGADVKTGCGWIIFTTANAQTGNNGQDAVGTPVTQAGSVAAPSVTLAALAGADSLAVGILRHASASAPTVGTGFAEIGSAPGTLPTTYILAEGKLNTTTVNFSASSGQERLIGFEIKAATITAKSVSETGTGTDSATLNASLTTSQTGTGTDAASLAAVLIASQTAMGTDAATLATALSTSDAGSGADSASLTAAGSTSESGSGTDNADLSVMLTTSDVGATVDAASLDVALATSETGVGVDAASLGVDLTVADTATGTDAIGDQDRSVADTASSTEATDLTASLTASDVGVGVDAATTATTSTVSDAGVGTESVSLEAALAVLEAATAAELAQLVAALVVAEVGTGTDSATGGLPVAAPQLSMRLRRERSTLDLHAEASTLSLRAERPGLRMTPE